MEKKELTADQLVAIMNMKDEFEDREDKAARDPRTGRYLTETNLSVSFRTVPQLDKGRTYFEGTPVYVDLDMITIIIPGDRNTVIDTMVTEDHKNRFPLEYQAFKAGKTAAETGTPLNVWFYLKPAEIKTLESAGIRTLEQLASLNDNVSGPLLGFVSFKRKAAEFLATLKDTSAANKLQEQLESSQAEVNVLKEQMAQLMNMMAAQAEAQEQEAKKGKK